jgi:alanyl-tRNA synthetase
VTSLHRAAELMHVPESELVEQVEKAIEQRRALERQLDQLKAKVAQAQLSGLEHQARTVNGVRVLAARVDGLDRQQMRAVADSLRNKWKSAVIVLASADESSVAIVSAVTKDLTAKVHAGKLAGALAQAVGGKGGGRPDMAEAGGKDASQLGAALDGVYASVEPLL